MREDPQLDHDAIATCLTRDYGIRASTLTFLPLGYDPHAWAYRAESGSDVWFVKLRRRGFGGAALEVPAALAEAGVPNVLAPVRALDGTLACTLDGQRSLAVFPFVAGESAMAVGLTEDQWRAFGATLRAVHDSGLEHRFAGSLRTEDFSLPSSGPLRKVREVAARDDVASPAARELAACYRENAARIDAMLTRTAELGRALRSRSLPRVLCHGDIHAANIIAGQDGRIWLVDWDAPLIAPRERDLLFVVGSRIARQVIPREEALFFEGYGPVSIDRDALAYARYERIVEDLGAFGERVFLDPDASEAVGFDDARLAMALLAPGGDLDRAETLRVPSTESG